MLPMRLVAHFLIYNRMIPVSKVMRFMQGRVEIRWLKKEMYYDIYYGAEI